MSANSSSPNYYDLERSLRGLEAMGAAEAHGVIAGVLCAPRSNAATSARIVFADADAADSAVAERLLGPLRLQTETLLAQRESDFAPLLPDEGASLAERVAAVADFCRGYVMGLVAGGVRDLGSLSGDAREVIGDFVKIAEVETDAVATETEERALAELIEYVRVGVQLVYEEHHPPG